MKRSVLVPAVVALVVVVGAAWHHCSETRHSAPANSPSNRPFAPDFSLIDLAGQKQELAAYRNNVVLLDFWATWCDPCRKEIPQLVELQNKYGVRGLQIIGISMDDGPEPVREFTRQFKTNYPIVMGNANLGDRYGGILGLPAAFVIEPGGRIYARHLGATDVGVLEKEILALLSARPS